MTHNSDSDESQIRALIGAHFDALKWSPGSNSDWKTFSTDFLPEAQLFPAARPVQAKSLSEFIERMNRVAQGSLQDFEERTLGMTIQHFGNGWYAAALRVIGISERQVCGRWLNNRAENSHQPFRRPGRVASAGGLNASDRHPSQAGSSLSDSALPSHKNTNRCLVRKNLNILGPKRTCAAK